MPGHLKQVRFAHAVDVRTMTPALTTSSWSPASSGALLTPPSPATGLPGPTPYYVAFPTKQPQGYTEQYQSSLRLHKVLRVSSSPILRVDLREPPSRIGAYAHNMSSRAFTEPATEPPTSKMTISCPHLPWLMTIRASERSYVTVMDVFEGVYYSLGKNCSSSDYYTLPTEKDRRRATVAYEERYRRIRSTREYEDEKRMGLRRVDFLMGHVMFRGLHASPKDSNTWILNVD